MTETSRLDGDTAWGLLLEVRQLARQDRLPDGELGFGRLDGDPVAPVPPGDAGAAIRLDRSGAWRSTLEVAPEAAELLDLYLAFACATPRRPATVAHLGQSLDGRIAAPDGDSDYVTGPENIVHLHRMRALADAVLVGAGTVEQDDPRLTTRWAAGDNPVRVVIDPRRRLSADYKIFRDDAAPTLLVCREDLAGAAARHGQAEVVGVAADARGLALADVVGQLHRRGLFAVFVEGGGRTVSRFLEQKALDRLQVAVAPMIIGAGRPGIALREIDGLGRAVRPRHRRFQMGEDVLFDCDLRA